MINVIINADDLGKSSEVNSEIDYALSKGYISSSTILANTSHWPEIHRIVDSHPQASFGIHLNLSEGKALTNSEILKKYGIVDSRNIFTGNILQTLNSDKVEEDLREAIYDEWDAQLDLLINVERIRITHLDGHHHVHRYPLLQPYGKDRKLRYQYHRRNQLPVIIQEIGEIEYEYEENPFSVLDSGYAPRFHGCLR